MLNKEECEKALESAEVKTTEVEDYTSIPKSTYCCIENELNVFKQLIKEHFDLKGNSLDFKNFKLHADNTLKGLSKDDLISYIHMLHHNWSAADKRAENMSNYAKQLNKSFDKSLDILAEKCECESCWCKDCKVRCTDEDCYDSWKKECKSRWREYIENECNCN